MHAAEHKKFEILDCTIRDGGYLNNWDFDNKLVKDVYRNLSRTGVDIIEIGFRNVQKKGMGIWVSTPEELIHSLFKDCQGAKIALLIDVGGADTKNIPDSKESLVRMYRVATHKNRVREATQLCEVIKEKGYLVSLQLMGIIGYSDEEIRGIVEPIKCSRIDYVYFADSYGSLYPSDIKRYIHALKPTGKKIGFHPHNNLQLAFANTLEAIKHGIDIVDGTVYGMGRGAGNLPLEVLITYLEKNQKVDKYNSMPVLDLIDRHFKNLHAQLGWGYSLPYMLSGANSVHPNYAKHMMSRYHYTVDDMVKVLDIINDVKPVGFKSKLIDDIISSGFVSPLKDVDPNDDQEREIEELSQKYEVTYKNRHPGRNFLILANGPSLKKNKKDVQDFIDHFNPVVIGANFLGGLFRPDYHAFSNKKRFIDYVDRVDPKSKLLLSVIFEDDFIRDYTRRDYERIVHINRMEAKFDIINDIISTNCRTVSTLCIAIAIIMGAKKIYIAGMDGYKSKESFLSHNIHFYDEKTEMQEKAADYKAYLELHKWNEKFLTEINEYLLSHDKDDLQIITPTSHRYFYHSVYNWGNK